VILAQAPRVLTRPFSRTPASTMAMEKLVVFKGVNDPQYPRLILGIYERLVSSQATRDNHTHMMSATYTART